MAGRARRTWELVGVAGFQHREFGLADLLDDRTAGEPSGRGPGNVATVNMPAGPTARCAPAWAAAIYLVTEGERRAAVLLRGPAPGLAATRR